MIETDDLEPILDRVHEWTRAADAKVDILTAIEAGVVALLIPALVPWIQDPVNASENKFKFLLGLGNTGWGESLGDYREDARRSAWGV